jgi:GR25 family glycosyltransferase involved in LPS biosynthesis
MVMLINRIFYINLDEHEDRRKEMENEFAKMDIISHNQLNPDNKTTYERFSAIKHENIGVGRGKSHIEILKIAKEREYSTIIIFEDDMIFTITKDELKRQLGSLKGMYIDVCLLSGNLINYNSSTLTHNIYRVVKSQMTSGYLINCRYNNTLISCFQTAVENLERTNNNFHYAIDVAWNKLQVSDPWYALKTMIGQQRINSSCTNHYKLK